MVTEAGERRRRALRVTTIEVSSSWVDAIDPVVGFAMLVRHRHDVNVIDLDRIPVSGISAPPSSKGACRKAGTGADFGMA